TRSGCSRPSRPLSARHSPTRCAGSWSRLATPASDARATGAESAFAELVVHYDDAAGGVVRDVRTGRLPLGRSLRRTHSRRIVEVGLEHAEVRGVALGGGDVEGIAVAAQSGPLGHQLEVGLLVVAPEVIRVGGRRIEDEQSVHGQT